MMRITLQISAEAKVAIILCDAGDESGNSGTFSLFVKFAVYEDAEGITEFSLRPFCALQVVKATRK